MEKNCEQAEEILLNFYTNFLRSEKGEEVVLRLRVQKFLDLIKVNPIEAIQLARERFSNVKEHTIKLISDNNKQVKYKIKDLMNILVKANDEKYAESTFFSNTQREFTCDFINNSLLEYSGFHKNSTIQKLISHIITLEQNIRDENNNYAHIFEFLS